MIEFLKNIIPRIQKYSKGLDKIEVFVDKTEPWIYIDENGGQHQYIFLREGKRLIMISNGITKVGKWELLPTNQLLIDRISDIITLDHLFVEKALLILKRSGTDDLPFVLISREEIPDLDVEGYLEKFEREKERKELPNDTQKYRINSRGEIYGPQFIVGKKIDFIDGQIHHGTFKKMVAIHQEFVTIEYNTITRVFYRVKFTYNKKSFIIEQREYSEPNKGDIVLLDPVSTLPHFKYFDITDPSGNSHTVKIDDTGNIVALRRNHLRNLILILFWFLGFLFVLQAVLKNN
jgi:hypothetical protein